MNLTDWQLRGGADYDFDDDVIDRRRQDTSWFCRLSQVILSTRIVSSPFERIMPSTTVSPMVGGFGGQLSDGGEAVRLRRPDVPPV